MRLWFGIVMLAALASPASTPIGQTVVGTDGDPCTVQNVPPHSVARFIADAKKLKGDEALLQPMTKRDLREYNDWQRVQTLTDFANICRYEALNRNLPVATDHRIVFFGDSIIQHWLEIRPGFFSADRIDRGISGQTTAQMIGRFQSDVIALRPRIVHILAGTNDIAGNTGVTSLSRVEDNLRTMVELSKAHGIKVVIATLLPARQYSWRPQIDPVPEIASLNAWIRAYGRDNDIPVVDYYALLDDGKSGLSAVDSSDGVHPNSAAYAKMEAALVPVLDRALRWSATGDAPKRAASFH